MKFRVWIEGAKHWSEGDAVEAESSEEAAQDFVDAEDSRGTAFPENNNGDKCVVHVCDWDEVDEDSELGTYETFKFKLVIDRQAELQR